MTALSSVRVQRALTESGVAHVDVPHDLAEFRILAAQLGYVVAEERIAIRAGAHAYVAQPGPVPVHNDQAQVDIVAWHCVNQDAADGASLLCDGLAAIATLPHEVREVLRRTRLACPPVAGGPPSQKVPVLSASSVGRRLFCSPWLEPVDDDPVQRAALMALAEVLNQPSAPWRSSVRMSPGQSLFIDNRRILHGREAIEPRSPRHLERVWIITDDDVTQPD